MQNQVLADIVQSCKEIGKPWKDDVFAPKNASLCPAGEWKEDYMEGHGTYKRLNGNTYIGKLLRNKPSGKGTFYYASGITYSGDWLNGKRHGKG